MRRKRFTIVTHHEVVDQELPVRPWLRSRVVIAALFVPVLATAALLPLACKQSSGRNDAPFSVSFSAVVPLTAAQALAIVETAAAAADSPNLIVAVVDRIGNLLALWHRNPAASVQDQNRAVSIARTGAFMSSSQGPISSRTLEFISAAHFPATFGAFVDPEIVAVDPSIDTLTPQRDTTGVAFTPQGPLWQIFSTNRGAPLAGAGLTLAETGVETLFNAGMSVPPATKIDGTAPGPGLSYLPGGVPLFNAGRLVGGIGCYVTDPTTGDPNVPAMEFAAFSGASTSPGFAAVGVPNEGAIFLVGVLLPYLEHTLRPVGVGEIPAASLPATAAGTFEDVDPVTVGVQTSRAGSVDPEGYLIGPRADPLGNLTLAEVTQIVDQSIEAANNTRAAIRLPIGVPTRMIIAVTNLDGLILALYRIVDAPIFSIDVAVAKARNVVYFSGASVQVADQVPGTPVATAITNRTLGFLTQPFFPPGQDAAGQEGPMFQSLAVLNQDPDQYNRMANAPFRAGLQSGVVLFPGSAPLYKSGVLVGGLGISGDGVEQDDYVTSLGHEGFEAPLPIRADQYFFDAVRLPYFKFPQLPGGTP